LRLDPTPEPCYNTPMIKHCIICGATFAAPPSSKKVTCSPACSAARKTASHTGKRNTWSPEARRQLSARRKAEGYTPNARAGLTAAMARPDSQRGPQHREAKVWTLIDPEGHRHEVTNLLHWARINAHLFDTPADAADRERIANNIRSGFGQIVQSRLGHKKHPCYTYKGWTLGDWPRHP